MKVFNFLVLHVRAASKYCNLIVVVRHADDKSPLLKTDQSNISTRNSRTSLGNRAMRRRTEHALVFEFCTLVAGTCSITKSHTKRYFSWSVFSADPSMMPMILFPPPPGFGWSWMPAVLKQLAHSFLNHVRCTCSA